MIKRLVVVGLVGVGLSAVACSGSDGGSGGSLDSACDTLVQALCGKLEECIPLALRLQYKDTAECRTRQKQSCLTSFAAPGTIATASTANDCASAYSAQTCDALFSGATPGACRISGSLTDGTACGASSQCAGSNCRKANDNACGACSTRAAAGGTCTTNGDCDYDLACANGTCVVRVKAGAACSATAPCEGNLRCVSGTCAVPLEAGASCDGAGAAQGCNALKGLACDPTTKVCTQVKIANAGEPCGLVDGAFVVCAAAGKCKTAAATPGKGVCEAAAADGQPCNVETGPNCIEPAECTNGVCTLSNPSACK